VRGGLLLGCVAVFTIVTKALVAQAFLVPTASMADTLRPGDQARPRRRRRAGRPALGSTQ
jgi:hypothetical protein